LVDVGFFASYERLKKNRPDLWRRLIPGETVTLDWVEIVVQYSGGQVDMAVLGSSGGGVKIREAQLFEQLGLSRN
jgi:hypothetical protein